MERGFVLAEVAMHNCGMSVLSIAKVMKEMRELSAVSTAELVKIKEGVSSLSSRYRGDHV